jgi:type IV pilus assembly protein PilX
MNSIARFTSRCRQAGLSLLVVLIALVIISFAAIALLRSSDIGTLIVGNLGFQKTALAAGDAGTEVAVTFLTANSGGNALFNDRPAGGGYYATIAGACDLTGTRTPNVADDVNWTGVVPAAGCNMVARTLPLGTAGVPADYTVRYVINRVCNGQGDPNLLMVPGTMTPMACSRLGAGASEGSTRGGASYGNLPLTGEAQTYYRITTRIDGPRNTVRYVQVLVVI